MNDTNEMFMENILYWGQLSGRFPVDLGPKDGIGDTDGQTDE